MNRRQKNGHDGKIAIISLERLYPLPTEELVEILRRYAHVTDVRFVQDEPENQGAWPFMAQHLPGAVKELFPEFELDMKPITRPWSSAPSVGSFMVHKDQEDALLSAALD